MAVKAKKQDSKYEKIPTKTEKVSQELSCQLNQVQWQNRATELAEAQRKAEQEEQRKKDVMKEIGADVARAKSLVSKLANIVSTRHEQRDVTVEVTYDYEKGLVTEVRTDTQEQVSQREMTTNERQSGLFDNENRVSANDIIENRHKDEDNVDIS